MLQIITLISLIFLFSGCSTNSVNINAVFEKKYGEEVKKMNASRVVSKESFDKNARLDFAIPTAESNGFLSNVDQSEYEQYANVDREEYKSVPPKDFFPNAINYEQAKSTPDNLPKNMFDINYNTALNPPFKRSGVEFDLIKIPSQDFYGIKTAIEEKEYLLVGNDSLQKDIDYINKNKTTKEIELTKVLVKEQREIRRNNKMIKVFGEDLSSKKDSNSGKK